MQNPEHILRCPPLPHFRKSFIPKADKVFLGFLWNHFFSSSKIQKLVQFKGSAMSKILRLKDIKTKFGLSKSSIYSLISNGYFPRGFKIGVRAVGWLEPEIERVLSARAAGKTEEQIKMLVSEINSQVGEL